jgi:fermentation-respiration switch protein FrsA (DUF1100 family)
MLADRDADNLTDVATSAASPSVMRRLLRLFILLIVGYALIMVMAMLFESYLIYPTWQIPPGNWNPTEFAYEDVMFTSDDGTSLHGWFFEYSRPQAVVLYCHGNGENVAWMGPNMARLRDTYQISIFAFDFRGYGKSEGRPQEAGVIADGKAARAWLSQRAGVDPQEIVLWGRSLGGAVAVQLAADTPARGMILDRTFSSLTDVAAHHYPWLPVRRLLRDRYDSVAMIGRHKGPLLQSHGTLDQIIPCKFAEKLFAAAESAQPKRLFTMTGVGHNDPEPREYGEVIADFFQNLP